MIYKKLNLLLLLIMSCASFVLTSCKTVKPVRPMEKYEHLNEEWKVSEINVPVSIDFGAMEKEINAELTGILYEEDTDDYAIRAEKTADVTLALNGQELKYYVPLKIWVRKDIGVAEVQAEGEVAMEFKTDFEINNAWDIITETDLIDHEWLTKPRLKMGFIDVPVENLMSIILNKSSATITQQIDEQIESRLDLRYYIDEAWKTLEAPIEISRDPRLWLEIEPKSISMTPLKSNGQIVSSTIYIATNAAVSLGDQPENDVSQQKELPPLEFSKSASKGFQLNMIADVPYDEAASLAKEHIVGETFQQGKYEVKIEDIDIYGSDDKLVVETDLSGSYDGKVYLEGIPFFNEAKNQIEMREVDYELKTKNFLAKTMSWIFHKNFEKRIKENLVFPLDKQFETIKQKTAQQLKNFKVNENTSIQGILADIKIERTYLTPKSIRVQFASSGDLNLFIEGLKN